MASKRRIDVRSILADPDLRRRLMVPTIQATQAREGIETSADQAERAYYVVTEGERAAFFDLSRYGRTSSEADNRAALFERALAEAVEGVRFDVARRDLALLESASLLYAEVQVLAPLYRENAALGEAWADVRGGMNSTASERFVRFWFEASKGSTRRWVAYSKGGGFARFYSDLDLVLDWTNDGAEFRSLVKARYGSESRFVKSTEFYFRRGLTWTEKSSLGLSVRLLPAGAIFNVAGPAAFPRDGDDEWFLLAILNSRLVAYCAWAQSGRNYGASYVASLPIAGASVDVKERLSRMARTIHRIKASWDEGNEVSTGFRVPWLLREDLRHQRLAIVARLDRLHGIEAEQEAHIRQLYEGINEETYSQYGVTESTRATIEETLGERPPEVLWPQMEGKTVEQKRLEHVYRLLSYVVRRVIDADQDGIVPFVATAGETSLLERVHDELARVFAEVDVGQVEVDIANELKKDVKGYRRVSGIAEWLETVFFDYHCSLHKSRPILWHVASAQGTSRAAFGALLHYHRFDADRMAKLRARYVKDCLDTFLREAALAEKAGRTDERREWQAKAEELAELDTHLQWVQEGRHEGDEGGDRDFRILTPWKPPHARPKGWDPDIDDGVKVNVAPLQKAGVLRRAKVI